MNNRLEKFIDFVHLREESTRHLTEYWREYSNFSTLQFWIMVAILVIPLIILIIKIDKEKLFVVCFYGYSIHITFAYLDLYGVNKGLWGFPFQVFPFLPSFSLDSSLVPVSFMLVYQWTLNKKKNYYLYSIITAFILAFIFDAILVRFGLFEMYKNTNYFHLFIGNIITFLFARFLTIFFLKFSKYNLH